MQLEIGADLLAPGRRQPLLVLPDADIGRRRRFGLVGIRQGLPRRRLLRDRFCEAVVCTVSTFGSSSGGFFDSFCVTTRSGSSVSVGVSFGRSVGLISAFCSASAGEATEASVSGPGGRSVASVCGDDNSTPISMAFAPSNRRYCRPACARSPAPRRRHEARARPRREKPQPPGRLLLEDQSDMVQGFAPSAVAGCAAASGTPSSATSFIR